MINLTAHAKLNLYLHIVGKRADNYHLLDSLFAYTAFGDTITLSPSETLSLQITGPFAKTLATVSHDNLMYRAARLLKEHAPHATGAAITLEKNIPVGAGLGGGSADAAATLLGLNTLWKVGFCIEKLAALGVSLGADVPACLYGKIAHIGGIGDQVTPLDMSVLDHLPTLLIKPPAPLSTPEIYQRYSASKKEFSPLKPIPTTSHLIDTIALLKTYHNDLAPPAIAMLPEIESLLDLLAHQPGCLLARMSGSGPTCFAFFENTAALEKAAAEMTLQKPDYWIVQTAIAPLIVSKMA